MTLPPEQSEALLAAIKQIAVGTPMTLNDGTVWKVPISARAAHDIATAALRSLALQPGGEK